MRKAIKQFFQNFKKDQRGLTLVELLAVIVILAIVGLIAFIAIGNVIDNSRKDAHVANAQQIISAAELYEASGGNIDEDSENLIADIDTIDENMVDPWNNANTGSAYKAEFILTYDGEKFLIDSTHEKCSFSERDKVTLADEGRKACDQS